MTADPELGFPEGYLDSEEPPLDPWGEPYEYFSDGEGYEVFSKGPDTTPSTEDDIRISKGMGGR